MVSHTGHRLDQTMDVSLSRVCASPVTSAVELQNHREMQMEITEGRPDYSKIGDSFIQGNEFIVIRLVLFPVVHTKVVITPRGC